MKPPLPLLSCWSKLERLKEILTKLLVKISGDLLKWKGRLETSSLAACLKYMTWYRTFWRGRQENLSLSWWRWYRFLREETAGSMQEGKEGRQIGVGRRGCRGELTRVPRLPNSNLGVGWVGKWAQCGVMLRAFAIRTHPTSPWPALQPSSSRKHLLPQRNQRVYSKV